MKLFPEIFFTIGESGSNTDLFSVSCVCPAGKEPLVSGSDFAPEIKKKYFRFHSSHCGEVTFMEIFVISLSVTLVSMLSCNLSNDEII